MLTTQKIVFNLKKSLLEYSLKNRIDYLVRKFACDDATKFSTYEISSIRFELYNLYIIVKNRKFHLFDTLIQFLIDFNSHFPQILEEKLYMRVLVSLKAMFIYDCLRLGELKKTSLLIKEYFPTNLNYNILNSPSSDKNKLSKSSLEIKILKLRSEWNELILNKSKRDAFFEKQFKVQYDDEFLNFLLVKVNAIIERINKELPMTQLEMIIADKFRNVNKILFDSENLELDLEDDVRMDLILDNLKLHQIHLECSMQAAPKTNDYLTKYLKKIYKILIEWQASMEQRDLPEDIISQTSSQQCPDRMESIVHDMLYLDSQFDNISLEIEQFNPEDSVPQANNNNNNQSKNVNQYKQVLFIDQTSNQTDNITADLTQNLTKCVNETTTIRPNTTKILNFLPQNTNKKNLNITNDIEANNDNQNKKNMSDLITDDERDPNLSA